jgi:trimeric autotransporter adhesin
VTGGTSVSGTVTLLLPAPTGGVSVSLSSNNGAASVIGQILIPAGQLAGSFTVSTTPVATAVNATITATSSNSVNGAFTINAPCVQGLNLSVGSILGGGGLTGTVTLTGPAPAGGSNVQLAYVGALLGPSNVLVPAGQTSAPITLSTSAVGTLLASTVQGLLGQCGGVTANVNVNAPALTGLSVSPSTINLLGTSTGTVNINGPAPAGGLNVGLSTSGLGSLLGMPSSVTIPAGATSATFSVSNLISALSGLLSNVTGSLTATLNGLTQNAPITLKVL